jgi:cytidine deaminase
MLNIIQRAIKKAEQSTCKMKVAALGFNRDGVCVSAKTNKPRFQRKGGGMHAERLVMEEAKVKGIVKILICRIGKGSELRPIDPCPACQGT